MKTTPAKGIAYAESTDLMRDYPTAVSKPAAETIDAALRAQDSFNTETRNVVVNKVASEWLPNQANITTHASTPFHARTGPTSGAATDLNQLTEPGLYRTNSTAPNLPNGLVKGYLGALEVTALGTTIIQELTVISSATLAGVAVDSSSTAGLVFRRVRTGTTWRGWQHVGGSTSWHAHGITMDSGWTLKPVLKWRLNSGNIEWVGALLNSTASGNTRVGVLHADLAPDLASVGGWTGGINFPSSARSMNHTIEIKGVDFNSWVQSPTAEWRPMAVIYPAII